MSVSMSAWSINVSVDVGVDDDKIRNLGEQICGPKHKKVRKQSDQIKQWDLLNELMLVSVS